MDIWQRVNDDIFLGALDLNTLIPVAGGDICSSFKVQSTVGESFFIKTHSNPGVLETEFQNLGHLAKVKLASPEAIGVCSVENCAALVLPFLSMTAHGDETLLGQQLALMHRHVSSDGRYGLAYNNYIGANKQVNTLHERWADFWWQCRLLPQLRLAESKGVPEKVWHDLESACTNLLSTHQPQASLLHGDLWSGNKAYQQDATPVVFDPATYYGDRETDIAFTRVFGGFSKDFYQAYQKEWSLPEGWQQRQHLYNLYHLLNHLNLFGEAYLSEVLGLIQLVSTPFNFR
ncbi:fructosamine kinase family protein [Gilvimarinus chinensis]|uniref:fructosamine kinase family protein n=1 Tax=Gilvimarinus chinensis TaxID=396005 RepID=UPI00036B4BAA|nr:fructosamine kinase family protein [Gilvimarinus chinensis]